MNVGPDKMNVGPDKMNVGPDKINVCGPDKYRELRDL
jgi:hypothetical protein